MPRTLIIGGTGSLGRKLIERLLPSEPVAVYSRDESKHFTIRNEFSSNPRCYEDNALRFYVGDIRDQRRLAEVMRQYEPYTIIVAAALKHVDTCELSPSECIATNVMGVQNVVDVVNTSQNAPCNVLFVSTDKCVSPVNVYGMCKAISERLVTTQTICGKNVVRFLAVRYGNVLESRGSIIPLFKHQGMHNDCLTVTDPNMTRFMMTLDQSVELIQQTLKFANCGEVWIPRLPSMRIGDLAEIFSEEYDKPIKVIGLRPGEKLHEDLINESESVRTEQTTHGNYYAIKPAFTIGNNPRFTYCSSDDVLTKEQLRTELNRLGILKMDLDSFKGLRIEEIRS